MTTAPVPANCCDAFAAHVSEAGNRGMAIIAAETVSEPYFLLQSRGCDYGDIPRLRAMSTALKRADFAGAPHVNIVCEMRIRFCPWCGTSLDDIIRANREGFRELAERMAHLLQERTPG